VTSCTADAQCVAPNVCSSGACAAPATSTPKGGCSAGGQDLWLWAVALAWLAGNRRRR
jgi:MYXO-CTERM domain-containing protein